MNKKKWTPIFTIFICIFIFICSLHITDKVIFHITMGHHTQEKKEEIKKNQKNYSIFERITYNLIAGQLDREEKNRLKRKEAGLPVAGRDTHLIWHDKYTITKYSDVIILEFYANNERYRLLHKISDFKVKNDKLYVLSEEGYAVIDEKNICKIFINNIKESHYVETDISVKDNHLQYLSTFNEFSKEEKKTFKKLENK